MKKRPVILRLVLFLANIALGAGLSFCLLYFWVKRYPKDDDPKNIEYVLWKYDLNQNMNLDDALSGMTHDSWAVKLVEGERRNN